MTSFFQVPPRMGIDEWTAEYRFLSPEASSEPGKYRIERAEYQRGIMQAISDPMTKEVVLMCSSQVGKTEILMNVLGYHIHYDPAPILVVQPTLDMAQSFSKERLANMIRDCEVLSGKVQDSKSKDSGNTILHKRFPQGHITLCGANSPAGLASRPIRIVLLDEVDRYPPSAGAEGDPVKLAMKRSRTFWNKKTVMVSTPTIKGISRIEAAFEESNRQHFNVPCHKCGEMQRLVWGNVTFDKTDPTTARYKCGFCGEYWNDAQRWHAVRNGKWISEYPKSPIQGFHLNEIYSSWSTLEDMVRNFLEAKKFPETLKTFINTSLGESWEDQGEGLDEVPFMDRRENYYPDHLPQGIVVITAGVDVQDDRLEIECVGWGEGEECWSVEYKVIYGDPSTMDLWNQLDDFLLKKYTRSDGLPMPIVGAAIDSGGHYTHAVYNYCRGKANRRVWAIKGQAGQGVAIWPKKASVRNVAKVPLFSVGVDSAKDIIFARLKIKEPGAGYCHFPMYEEWYFEQLTAEKVVITYKKGVPVRSYKKFKTRNEALDCRVYAYAVFLSLQANMKMISQKLEVKVDKMREEGKLIREAKKEVKKEEVVKEKSEKELLNEKNNSINTGVPKRPRRPPDTRPGWLNSWRK